MANVCQMFYFGYLAGAFFSGRALQLFHAGKVIGLAFFLWGCTLLGCVGAKGFASLMALRFLLGYADMTRQSSERRLHVPAYLSLHWSPDCCSCELPKSNVSQQSSLTITKYHDVVHTTGTAIPIRSLDSGKRCPACAVSCHLLWYDPVYNEQPHFI